jgi:hypothetical protein
VSGAPRRFPLGGLPAAVPRCVAALAAVSPVFAAVLSVFLAV